MNDMLKDHEWNTECPGYGEESECGEPAEYQQLLGNDLTAYCERHTLMSAGFWIDQGFGSPNYRRISDGQGFKVSGEP